MSAPGENIVLIGSMGVGKSTIGQALAQALGRPFIDNDDVLQARTGKTPRQLLELLGRDGLHAKELEAFDEESRAARPSVLAAAASIVDSEQGRELLRRAGQVLYVGADAASLERRATSDVRRPLPKPGEESLAALNAARASRYREVADAVLETSALSIEQSVRVALRALQRVVQVPLGERSYDVVIGPGARHLLSEHLPARARRAAIVTQEGIDYALEPGIEHFEVRIEKSERAKSLATVEELCRAFARAGLTRNDVIIGHGGGVVTDIAGFAASVYHRGMDVVHVASTLLGQVDAAIGGKTGVNLPEGKNLVGAFWQPAAVLCDTDMLLTLPEREQRSGHGEMAKYAFLGVEDLDELSVPEQVAACVALKAAVVSADEREGDARMILNYGHTLAHALEAAGFADRDDDEDGIDLRHGEAVAIGLVFAARLAQLLGRIEEPRVERHHEIVRRYGLPETIPVQADHEELITLMGRDKKATAGLTFMLDGPSGVQAVRDVSHDVILEALARCTEHATASTR